MLEVCTVSLHILRLWIPVYVQDIAYAWLLYVCIIYASGPQWVNFHITKETPRFIFHQWLFAFGCSVSPFHQKRWLRRTWRRQAEGHVCLVPNIRSWRPWADKTEAQTLTMEKTHSPPLGNERWDLETRESTNDEYKPTRFGIIY